MKAAYVARSQLVGSNTNIVDTALHMAGGRSGDQGSGGVSTTDLEGFYSRKVNVAKAAVTEAQDHQ
jgi:hypothetical protein